VHKILEEQVKRLFGETPLPPKWVELLGAVSETYTEKEHVEQEVKDRTRDVDYEKKKLNEIAQNMTMGSILLNYEGKVQFVNRAAEAILQSAEGDDIMKKFLAAFGSAGAEAQLQECLKGKQSSIPEVVFGDRTFTILFRPIITAEASLLENLIWIEDITEEKKLDRAQYDFISIASHQLRTPLTGISWVIDLFKRTESLSDKGKDYLKDIQNAAMSLNRLVDDLLNASRIEAGGLGTLLKPVVVTSMIERCIGETKDLALKKGITVTFDHPDTFSATTDETALHNIFLSLISNATDYTPPTGTIKIFLEKTEKSFLVKVKDTGMGIPKAEQGRLFERFFRASNAKNTKSDGTGLGLFIAKSGVTLLGGKIWFESEEGKGTTFFVDLPLQSPEIKGDRQLI
jgi:signal transduction histidine kinase